MIKLENITKTSPKKTDLSKLLITVKDAIYMMLNAKGKIDGNNPYINVLVPREDNKDSELLKKLVKAYQTKDTAEVINKSYKGASIPVFKY